MGNSCVVSIDGVDHLVPRGGSLTLGSADSADVQIDDPVVQGIHARIDDIDDDFLYVDESTEGSFLGDAGRSIRGGSYLLPAGTTVVFLAAEDGPRLTIGVSRAPASPGGSSISGSPPAPMPPPAPLPPQEPLPRQEPVEALPSAIPPPPGAEPAFVPPGDATPLFASPPGAVGDDLETPDFGPGPLTAPTTPPPPPPPSSGATPPGPSSSIAAAVAAPPSPPPTRTTPPPPSDGTEVPPDAALDGDAVGAGSSRRWWQQPAIFVVIAMLGLVAAVLAYGVVRTSGTTSAQDIEAGKCYEEPSGEFARLQEQDCAGVHDLEVIYIVTMPPGPFPTEAEFEGRVNESCGPEFDTVNWEALPLDADGGWFEPNRAGWEIGDHDLACYVYSDSGLVGPVPRLDG